MRTADSNLPSASGSCHGRGVGLYLAYLTAKGRQPPKAINALAGSQQVEFHNRTRVRRADELIDLSTKRPRVSGSGRWKQLDPRQVLRTTFDNQT